MSLLDWFRSPDVEMRKTVTIQFNGDSLRLQTRHVNPQEKDEVILVRRESTGSSDDGVAYVKNHSDIDSLITAAIEDAYTGSVIVDQDTLNTIKSSFEQ